MAMAHGRPWPWPWPPMAAPGRVRQLLVLRDVAIRAVKPGKADPWLLDMLARRPKKVVAIALANRMARTLWAMMVTGEV